MNRLLISRHCLALVLSFAAIVPACAEDRPAKEQKSDTTTTLAPLVKLLVDVDDAAFRRDILNGIHKAIDGRRDVKMPAGWPKAARVLAKSPDETVRSKALELGVLFGDPGSLATLRRVTTNPKAKLAQRTAAIHALVQRRDPPTLPLLNRLLADTAMRSAAIRGLAAYDDPKTPQRLITLYARLSVAEKRDARATLASRPKFAMQLLAAIEKGTVPRTDVSAFLIRQMTTFSNKAVDERIRKVWGSVRPPKKDRALLIARFKKTLSPKKLKDANLANGRVVFRKTCASCHRLFDDGKRIGPELTGSQRTNLDYLLENLLDPNAVIGRDYRMTILVTDAGRLMTGIVKEESAKTLTLQTANESLIVAKSEIDIRKRSTVSMMPEGQLGKLPEADLRDLIGYLMSPKQVPLPTAP